MKTVSENQLNRLKKKGKVRKKMGAQPERKMLEPVAMEGEGMSGSVPEVQPVPTPEPQPMASMSASMEVRDGLLERVIENNTVAIENMRQALTEQKPRRGIGYRHKVNRDSKTSLIDEVISTPIETAK